MMKTAQQKKSRYIFLKACHTFSWSKCQKVYTSVCAKWIFLAIQDHRNCHTFSFVETELKKPTDWRKAFNSCFVQNVSWYFVVTISDLDVSLKFSASLTILTDKFQQVPDIIFSVRFLSIFHDIIFCVAENLPNHTHTKCSLAANVPSMNWGCCPKRHQFWFGNSLVRVFIPKQTFWLKFLWFYFFSFTSLYISLPSLAVLSDVMNSSSWSSRSCE